MRFSKQPCSFPNSHDRTGLQSQAKTKAQMNIDYLGGFVAFTIGVILISSIVMGNMPLYAQEMRMNAQKVEGWAASDRLMHVIESGKFELNETKTAEWSRRCEDYAFNDLRGYAGIKEDLGITPENGLGNEVNIRIIANPVVLADETITQTGRKRGYAVIEGQKTQFVVSKSDEESGKGVYDRVSVNSGPELAAGEKFSARSGEYTVREISSSGSMVLLEKTVLECGMLPQQGDSAIRYVRYSTHYGHPARVILLYW